MPETVEIYTDGACRGNPGPGGYAALVRYSSDHVHEVTGSEPLTTNNRMELMGAIAALESLESVVESGRPVRLYTDSLYVKDGITRWIQGWRRNGWMNAAREPVKNRDLWQRLDVLAQARIIEWCWVKGHSGHPDNDRADFLARQAAEKS
jgi:ribonuclease HI